MPYLWVMRYADGCFKMVFAHLANYYNITTGSYSEND